MDELEHYYSGDDAWKRLAGLYADEFGTKQDVKDLTAALDGHADLACVIYGKVGTGYSKWLTSRIPALANLTPVECLSSLALLQRLREMLMRMPA